MNFATWGRRVHKFSRMLEDPRTFLLHYRGVSADGFLKFNAPWFRNYGFRTVVDVGANVGQFAAVMLEVLPSARLYCFEPLPDCFEKLSKLSPQRITSLPYAAGADEKTSVIHRNVYPDSSSLRPMKQLHREQFPFTDGVDQDIQIHVRALDEVLAKYDLVEPILTKIDVQGFEDEVLKGGEKTLRRSAMAILEVSFEPLYDGAPSFDEIYSRMKSYGFRFVGCLDQLVGPNDGQILQGDALFIRE